MSRPFNKPTLSVDDQLELLIGRGLAVADRATAKHHLEHIGYYRLSGYTLPFQKGGHSADRHDFKPNSTFEAVLDRYIFDRRLRLLVMDAVERIEIAVRASLSNSIALRHGPHWYMDPRFFRPDFGHARFIADIKNEIGFEEARKGKRDVFIQHYYDAYNEPELPPCWMVFECISFGPISILFKNLAHPEYLDVCNRFSLNHDILRSWLHSISYVRNLCAHHRRLWNRIFTITPKAAKKYRDDLTPNTRVYAQLVVMQVLLGVISPGNHWAESLKELLQKHPQIPLRSMGFPNGWAARPVWSADR